MVEKYWPEVAVRKADLDMIDLACSRTRRRLEIRKVGLGNLTSPIHWKRKQAVVHKAELDRLIDLVHLERPPGV